MATEIIHQETRQWTAFWHKSRMFFVLTPPVANAINGNPLKQGLSKACNSSEAPSRCKQGTFDYPISFHMREAAAGIQQATDTSFLQAEILSCLLSQPYTPGPVYVLIVKQLNSRSHVSIANELPTARLLPCMFFAGRQCPLSGLQKCATMPSVLPKATLQDSSQPKNLVCCKLWRPATTTNQRKVPRI